MLKKDHHAHHVNDLIKKITHTIIFEEKECPFQLLYDIDSTKPYTINRSETLSHRLLAII